MDRGAADGGADSCHRRYASGCWGRRRSAGAPRRERQLEPSANRPRHRGPGSHRPGFDRRIIPNPRPIRAESTPSAMLYFSPRDRAGGSRAAWSSIPDVAGADLYPISCRRGTGRTTTAQAPGTARHRKQPVSIPCCPAAARGRCHGGSRHEPADTGQAQRAGLCQPRRHHHPWRRLHTGELLSSTPPDADRFDHRVLQPVAGTWKYQSYFNVHRVDVVSNESGADHPRRSVVPGHGPRQRGQPRQRRPRGYPRGQRRPVTPCCRGACRSAARTWRIVLVNDPEYGGSGASVSRRHQP